MSHWGWSIEFEIQLKHAMLWSKICSPDHNEMLHVSRKFYRREVYKNSLWSFEYAMSSSITKFHWILNSIEILLVGRPTDRNITVMRVFYLRDILQSIPKYICRCVLDIAQRCKIQRRHLGQKHILHKYTKIWYVLYLGLAEFCKAVFTFIAFKTPVS